MEIHELVNEMKYLERRISQYEEKYGVLSQHFYDALMGENCRAMTSMTKRELTSAAGKEYMKHGSAERNRTTKRFSIVN